MSVGGGVGLRLAVEGCDPPTNQWLLRWEVNCAPSSRALWQGNQRRDSGQGAERAAPRQAPGRGEVLLAMVVPRRSTLQAEAGDRRQVGPEGEHHERGNSTHPPSCALLGAVRPPPS